MLRIIKSGILAGGLGVSLLTLSGPAQAQIIPTLQPGSPTMVGSEFLWSYDGNLSSGFFLQAGDYFTIYDFQGFTGTHSEPANWSFSSANTGPTPAGLVPVDDPILPNLTWTYTGSPTSADGMVLGTFSARSSYGGQILVSFASTGRLHTPDVPVTHGGIAMNKGLVWGPAPVEDTEDPDITCPADITVYNDPGECGAVVTYAVVVTDDQPGVTVTCTPPSGSVFPVGMTTVTCVATDAAGHTATCSFKVTVLDGEPPTIEQCPLSRNISGDPNADCRATIPDLCAEVTATDNCPGPLTCDQTPDAGTAVYGPTSVTVVVTVRDAAGNVSDECRVVITVSRCEEEETGLEGCTPGFWKQHTELWAPTGFAPGQTLESVFDVPDELGLDNYTLLQALNFDGGPKVVGMARNLLRQGVAALLNAAHPDVDYPLFAAQVIADVNTALASLDRQTMEHLKDDLDQFNNLGCGIDAHGRPIDQ